MAEKKEIVERKKDFTYRGRTLEELKKMDLREFAKIIPSRERRTLLRNTDFSEKFVARCIKSVENKKKIRTHKRDLIIVPCMIGLTIHIHNGKSFEKILIVPEMIGHRFGEFSLTRRMVKHGAAGIGATKSSASRSVK